MIDTSALKFKLRFTSASGIEPYISKGSILLAIKTPRFSPGCGNRPFQARVVNGENTSLPTPGPGKSPYGSTDAISVVVPSLNPTGL